MAPAKINPKVRLLLVDDDEDDYLIIRKLLDKIATPRFKLDWSKNYEEATAIIARNKHDVYLLDYHLNDTRTGLDLLELFDVSQRAQPFIILTGAGDEAIEHRAMRLGVADYLIKGSFNAELLARVLRYSIQRKQMEARRLEHLIELNKTKDEFIAVASHQLRTPATAVKQYVGMLIEGYAGKLDQRQRQMLESAYLSNERQLKIINSLLQVAQANAGKITLHKTNLNLEELTQEVLHEHAAGLAAKKQQVELKTSPRHFQTLIKADRSTIRMVIDNLLDNAIKYSPKNKLISINLSAGKNAVSLSINNQGPSISKSDQAKLFEKFSRLDDVLPSAGSGLGLYWAKYLIDRHGGTISVESAKGKGATFKFTLPIKG